MDVTDQALFTKTFEKLLQRDAQSHKYTYGHVLIIGGSPGMVGAPLLSARAALRSGAGMVTIASTTAVTDRLDGLAPEIITCGYQASRAAQTVNTLISERKVTVAVIGPGTTADDITLLLLQTLLSHNIPVVIDGGALGAVARNLSVLLAAADRRIILTPHAGEFKKLINDELPFNPAGKAAAAERFAAQNKVTLVLKGNPTYVARPGGQVYENLTGTPALATAGSGDVLSGIIGGLLAQGIDAAEAAEAGTYVHGLAGRQAAQSRTVAGVIAGDIIEAIPAVYLDLLAA